MFAAETVESRSWMLSSEVVPAATVRFTELLPTSVNVSAPGLPTRTFTRRFRVATGYTPIDYVQTLRIEEAKQLLETGTEPVEAVAFDVGYEDANSFRRLFKRTVGITPARYRQRFSRIAMPAGTIKAE